MAERGKPDAKGLSFIDITDFSPGIYDNSVNVTGLQGNTPPGIFPAPPGAADVTATFGCMAGPTGGLEPMPGMTGTKTLGNLGILSAQTTITALAGSYQSFFDELVVGVTPAPSGGFQTTTFYSYVVGTNITNTLQTQTYSYGPVGTENFVAFPYMTTITSPGSGYQPALVLPLAAPAGPNSNLMLYPNPTAPTTYGVGTISQAASANGTSVTHQGRVLIFQLETGYGWPGGTSIFPNEQVNYTDPPESMTWPVQDELFGPEEPFGYGAVNSNSAGELFAIKCRGGAVIIQGDLNNPTVTSLPGVQSTGSIYGRSDSGVQGLYYCCDRNGAWLWSGSNSSQKLSVQLDDYFYANPIQTPDTIYRGYYCQRWGDWMLFSNNWVLDTKTGGWWRLYNPGTEASFFWYVPGFFSSVMYAAVPSVINAAQDFLFKFDRTLPTSNYTWQSLPLKLPAEDHTSTIREVVVRAANTYEDAGAQIVVSLIDDKGNSTTLDTWALSSGTNTIQETRLNAGMRQTTTVAVHLSVTATNYAPTIHQLSLGYRPREHVAIT